MTQSQEINDDFTSYTDRQRLLSKPLEENSHPQQQQQDQQPLIGEPDNIAAVYQELNRGERIATELEQMLESLDQKMELIMQMATYRTGPGDDDDDTNQSEDMERLQLKIEEKYKELSLVLESSEGTEENSNE